MGLLFIDYKTSPNSFQRMAETVQSHPPSPSPEHETASSRNSIEKWYIIWGLDTKTLVVEDSPEGVSAAIAAGSDVIQVVQSSRS